MNRHTRFPIVVISFLSLLLVGVYTAHAQDAPPKSGDSGRGAQTVVPVEPALPRGDVTPVPGRGGATQGPTDLHPESRPRRPSEASRDTRSSGTQPQSSSSSFPGPFSDLQAAVKVQPKNQVNIRSKTPCGSPECQGQALAIKKQSTAKTDVIKATSGKVTGSGFTGKARTGRR
jgi:hypothetical protein